MNRELYFAIVLFLLAQGCAWIRPEPMGPAIWTPLPETSVLAGNLLARWEELAGVSAVAKARFTEPGRETVFTEELLLAKPCSFRLTMLGLFDRPQAYVASDCRDLALHDVSNRRFFRGPADQGVLLDRFPIDLRASEVVAALLGHPAGFAEITAAGAMGRPAEDPQKRSWQFVAVPGGDVYWFDSGTHLPVRWSRNTPDGESLSVEWGRWSAISGVMMPGTVRLAIPGRQLALELSYSDLELNPSSVDESLFTLVPPKGVPVELLGIPEALPAPVPEP